MLVTGHTGFKGSWLAIWLHRLGARVTGYALPPPTEPSNFLASGVAELLAAAPRGRHLRCRRLAAVVAEPRPDVVFHLAAQSLVRPATPSRARRSRSTSWARRPCSTRCAALGRPCVVVVVTSDKCYENREQAWGYRESDPLGGHDPYSASKGAVEIVAAAYRRSFFPAGGSPNMASSWPRCGRATSSAAAIGPRTASCPTWCATGGRPSRCRCATRTPCVPGSTSWSRWAAI